MTETRLLAPPLDTLLMVSADQTSILGNGTTGDPLRVGPGLAGSFEAGVVNQAPQVGFFVVPVPPLGALRRVAPGDARASGGPGKQVVGVIAEVLLDGNALVQSSGTVTLSTAQWDAVTGQSGGLIAGAAYFLSVGPPSGHIATVAPSGSGEFVVQVGVAISPTQMILSVPSIVRQNP